MTARRRRVGGVDHVVSVRTTLARVPGVDGVPVELVDSSQFDPAGLEHEGFDAVTRAAHGKHRDDGRADKGRVIYLTIAGAVVGFVAFHVPPVGPFIVERLAIDQRIVAELPDSVTAMQRELLAVMIEASTVAGRTSGVVAWATDVRQTADAVTALFAFVRAQRPKGSDSRLRYYLELRRPG